MIVAAGTECQPIVYKMSHNYVCMLRGYNQRQHRGQASTKYNGIYIRYLWDDADDASVAGYVIPRPETCSICTNGGCPVFA